jgi:hypothetical protein
MRGRPLIGEQSKWSAAGKRMPCLTTPLVFFHSYHCGPQRVVVLRRGLGYRVLICRPIQGNASGVDLKIVVCPGKLVVQLPLVKGSPACSVLLVSSCHGSAGTPLGTHAIGQDLGLEESRAAICT